MQKKSWKFKRSKDKHIAGICGGIAEGMGWNPFLVRIGYIGFTIVTAILPGILFYLLLWLVMPANNEDSEA